MTSPAPGGVSPRPERASEPVGALSFIPGEIPWEAPAADGTCGALLHGDRQSDEIFSYAFFIPAGVWDAPHWHTADARISVVRGELRLGYGERLVPRASTRYPVGSYLFVPAGACHYDGADVDTIIVGTAVGPWATDYASSHGDPREA